MDTRAVRPVTRVRPARVEKAKTAGTTVVEHGSTSRGWDYGGNQQGGGDCAGGGYGGNNNGGWGSGGGGSSWSNQDWKRGRDDDPNAKYRKRMHCPICEYAGKPSYITNYHDKETCSHPGGDIERRGLHKCQRSHLIRRSEGKCDS
jgi:hypothetical protein